MKKQFLLTMMALLPMVADAYDAKIGDLFYNLNSSDKTATVTYETSMEWSSDGSFIMYFNNCSGDIDIPSTVTYKKVTYKVTSIGDNAFMNAKEMTSITIPSSVTSIGKLVFYYCYNLASIVVENGNSVYDSRGGCNAIIRKSDNELIYGCMNSTIPDGVKGIGESAFGDCVNLTSITIPNSVKYINDFAFGQSGLTSVTIGDGVTSIGDYAFLSCKFTSLTIPNSVTTIGVDAFRYIGTMTSLTLGNNVATISDRAFLNCEGLTSIEIPNSVTSIGNHAFAGCSGLTSLTIGNSVTSIGESAFIADLGNYQNSKLKDIYCYAPIPPMLSGSPFPSSDWEKGDIITLHVPSTCVDVYKDDKFWGSFATIVPIGAVGNKCATPTIKIESGILKFNCATDGVEYHYTVTAPERYSATGNNVQLPLTYTISVYATKSGWEASDVKQQEFYVTGGIRGDLNNDGFVNVADHVELSNIIFEQDK